MLTIFTNPDYDFIGRRRWAYAVSVALMLLALGSIVVKGGLQYDIDFTGGTLIEVRMPQAVSVGTIRARLAAVGLEHSLIQEFGDSRDVLIRTQVAATNPAELSQRVRDALALDRASAPEIRRVEFVGPQIGHDLRQQALYAVLAALGGILLYIWMRFDLRGGVATIVSVGHDVLICLGALSLTNREFSLSVLAALLTVIGFAVNDRIVMYDRLREIRAKKAGEGRHVRGAGQPRGESNAVAHGADGRHGGPLGGDAVPVRRRLPRELRLRGPGGRDHRSLVDGLRGGGARRGLDDVDRAAAGAARRSAGPRWAQSGAALATARTLGSLPRSAPAPSAARRARHHRSRSRHFCGCTTPDPSSSSHSLPFDGTRSRASE